MEDGANLFWFGFLVEIGFILVILKLVNLGAKGDDKLEAERNRLKRDYQRLQQELIQKSELTQECLRLQQELQQQREQITQEYQRLQQELQQQSSFLTQEHTSVQAELQHQRDQLSQERVQFQIERQQQEAKLTAELRHATFKQLQTLLTNYPSVAKIAQAKPDFPAKNLTPMFGPLDNLIQSWGYETIGSVWEQVPYDPKLHQPDAPDIEPGELVYIRFVGYRDGSTILCPAKISRTLTKAVAP